MFSQAAGTSFIDLGVGSDVHAFLDESYEYVPVENTAITQLTVWGHQASESGPCEINSLRVQARLDEAGALGEEIYSEELPAVTSEPLFGGTLSLIRYEISLPEPLNVEDGVWLRVVEDLDPLCYFLWMSSPQGDDLHGLVEAYEEDELSTTAGDLALCVYGEALTEGEGGDEGEGEPEGSVEDVPTELLDLIADFHDADTDADGKIDSDEAEDQGISPE